MERPDEGRRRTDEALAALEQRIASVYEQAAKELQPEIDGYFSQFAQRDAQQKALLEAGEITEEGYKQWRLAQIGRGRRLEALRDQVAERVTRANETAAAYVNDATPGIYALNRNYAAYTIEQAAGEVGFTLWDEQTVKRLSAEQPELMPYYPPEWAVRRGIDLAYGKQQVTAGITSSILQGRSVRHMADDLQRRITAMSRDSAIRTARTAVTGAQNAGRMDGYTAAEKMGIRLKKEWLATLDGRTRHSHAALDGERRDNGQPFSNGCMFPGDPSGAPKEVYSCRCTLIADVEGVDASDALRRDRDGLLPDMTFAQWEAGKRGYGAEAISPIRDNEIVKWRKSLQNQENLAILKEKIDIGEISTAIRSQQQAKHIDGTPQFEQYKQSRLARGQTPQSILTISELEAQSLIDKLVGTGTVEISKTGENAVKIVEFCDADIIVGKFYDRDAYYETRRFEIYYAKRGTHIVPVKEDYHG